MALRRMSDSTLDEMNEKATAFLGACGYEARASALASLLSDNVRVRRVIAFKEYPESLSRKSNEKVFHKHRFEVTAASSADPSSVETALQSVMEATRQNQGAVAFDISSMTRDWHGAIIRALIRESEFRSLETFFLYVPAQFQPPPTDSPYNEIVRPIDGFAALAPPSVPAALVMGLGYERDRALGLEELLDPKRTVLMIPLAGSREKDPFYHEVLSGNSDILGIVSPEWVFEYPLR